MNEFIGQANEEQSKEIELIKDIIVQTAAPLQIYLFGSYAYGEPNKDSDYDFYVVMPNDCDKENDYRSLISRKIYMSNIRKAVDIIIHKRSYFEERNPLPSMERTILRKGILLYDAG